MKNKFSFLKKHFSDKEKTFQKFFKLPKHDVPKAAVLAKDIRDPYTGIVNKINQDQQDDIDDIYDKLKRKEEQRTETKVSKFFSNLSNRDSMKLTENILERLRLHKEIKYSEDFKQKEILNEYGNYDKYFANYKKIEERKYDSDDDGEDVWIKNYQTLQDKYNNPNEAVVKNSEKELQEKLLVLDLEKDKGKYTFMDYQEHRNRDAEYVKQANDEGTNPREHEAFSSQAFIDAEYRKYSSELRREGEEPYGAGIKEMEITDSEKLEQLRFIRKIEETKEKKNTGVVSPWIKEEIYRNYLQGWTVRDLSYKYGLLPQRVRAIVWFRDSFWREVFPKVGESGTRILLQHELLAAKHYGICDYGKDLSVMLMMEKGITIKSLKKTEIDMKPPKEVEEKLSKALKNQKRSSVDYLPLAFIGKGPNGYVLKEEIRHKGRGGKRVSKMFGKYCLYKDVHDRFLPKDVREKMHLGPRLATIGYRF